MRVVLNAFLGKLITVIETSGGDILRVAGDAVIALFYRNKPEKTGVKEGVGQQLRAAAACASLCIKKLHDFEIMGIKLGLHIAIGAGYVFVHDISSLASYHFVVVAGS